MKNIIILLITGVFLTSGSSFAGDTDFNSRHLKGYKSNQSAIVGGQLNRPTVSEALSDRQ